MPDFIYEYFDENHKVKSISISAESEENAKRKGRNYLKLANIVFKYDWVMERIENV